jgi:hypothetical protein
LYSLRLCFSPLLLFTGFTTYVGVGTTEDVSVFVTLEIASVGTFVRAC